MNIDTLSDQLFSLARDSDKASKADFKAALERALAEYASPLEVAKMARAWARENKQLTAQLAVYRDLAHRAYLHVLKKLDEKEQQQLGYDLCKYASTGGLKDFPSPAADQLLQDRERLDWCLKYGSATTLGGALCSNNWEHHPITRELIDKALAARQAKASSGEGM